ncbi:MAG: hypothetical protein QW701_05260 [Candidatus Nezhaarchaeales archaeon]
MKDEEAIKEAIMDCKPYLTCWREVEEVIARALKESSDIHEFMGKLEEKAEKEDNILLKTDLKILISELKSKFRKI